MYFKQWVKQRPVEMDKCIQRAENHELGARSNFGREQPHRVGEEETQTMSVSDEGFVETPLTETRMPHYRPSGKGPMTPVSELRLGTPARAPFGATTPKERSAMKKLMEVEASPSQLGTPPSAISSASTIMSDNVLPSLRTPSGAATPKERSAMKKLMEYEASTKEWTTNI